MSELILVTELEPGEHELVRSVLTGWEVAFSESVADLREQLPRARAVVGHVGPEDLGRATRLEWLHSWIAGPDTQLYPQLRRSDVTLTSSAGNGGVPLAEHAMMLMLMLDRDAPRWLRAQQQRRWDRHVHGELLGRTVGIIGLGNAGTDLAVKAKAFGMRTLGIRRRDLPRPDAVDRLYDRAELHEFLSGCDFVVVTAPSTPETRGMLGPAEFAAMPSSSFFICISRGGIADDEALLTALRTGQIAGAGIDAHGVEPLPESSPFWSLPTVILTPHNGATTEGTRRRGIQIMVENLRRFRAGEPLLNVVDKHAGY